MRVGEEEEEGGRVRVGEEEEDEGGRGRGG